MPHSTLPRLIISLCCLFLIGASSCKSGTSKPPQDPGTSDATTMKGATTGVETTGQKVFVKKEPEDMGPRAPAVYMLSGLKGYTEPCGCTADVLLGGIDHITGYIQAARQFHPSMVILDGGNLWFEEPSIPDERAPQERLKALTVAKTYKKLGVRASVPGANDFALGIPFYAQVMQAAGLKPHGVNLNIEGLTVEGEFVQQLEGITLGVIPVVDPEALEGIHGVKATDPKAAVAKSLRALRAKGADTFLLLFHGQLGPAKTLLEAFPEVDFIQVGLKPRETDQVDQVGKGGWTLEPYDQGRYVGILKLYKPSSTKGELTYVNAKPTSLAEQEKIDRQIQHVHQSIEKLPPAAPGEESGILQSLRARIVALEARKVELEKAAVDIPTDAPSFVYRPVPIAPGYAPDPEVKAWRTLLNKEIKKANASIDFKIPPVEPGKPFYVGNTQCQSCHADAYTFWQGTNHGHALETLKAREKDYDQACVGCHVVGYEKPGGSVIGKLQYSAKLGQTGIEVTKDLRHVGCENCHGPGSRHVEAAMLGTLGSPKDHIALNVPASTCGQCHVPEHSPKFKYDVYIQQILGPRTWRACRGKGGRKVIAPMPEMWDVFAPLFALLAWVVEARANVTAC